MNQTRSFYKKTKNKKLCTEDLMKKSCNRKSVNFTPGQVGTEPHEDNIQRFTNQRY